MKKETERLILATNDDGFDAKGLKNLVDSLSGFGKVVCVAPETAFSGMSHAITINHPIRLHKIKDTENLTIYKCSGTPVDCVKIALDQILDRKPDLLVSGINHGSNASVSAIYSGTIAAALEGGINDIASIGFSLLNHSPHADFSAANVYVKKIINKVIQTNLPKEICLNVNFPNVPLEKIKGIRSCRQTKGLWIEEFDKRIDPGKREYYWLTGSFRNDEHDAEDTDEWALKHNYVSVVPLHSDLTAYRALEHMKHWTWNDE